MSTAAERLAAAKDRMDQISREHADRRELRERRSREARESAASNLAKQGQLADKTIERLQEMGKRQKAAGGWNTSAATEKKAVEYRFGADDEDQPYESAPPPAQPWAQPAPAQPSWSTPPTTPLPAQPAPPPPPPRAPRRAPRVDEDDDFGSQTWLT
ncbi:hypothetical protein [Actinosynnema sp. NPDC020468]|uniref:hypothetical protein n=1 Tax=Actinosynnema sp. NPDC020468 TaxID=3154488 RepID=UPI0033F2C737